LRFANGETAIDIVECRRLFRDARWNARLAFDDAPFEFFGALFLTRDTLEPFFPTEKDFDEGNYCLHHATPEGSIPFSSWDPHVTALWIVLNQYDADAAFLKKYILNASDEDIKEISDVAHAIIDGSSTRRIPRERQRSAVA
jgi:hypothetical protein